MVTVGLDTMGAQACRPFIEAAAAEHPSLIDEHHVMAELFGVINIPNGVWIDEDGMIVRPAEVAPAPRKVERAALAGATELPDRIARIFGEASRIQTDPGAYEVALRDWVARGSDSIYALDPAEVIARSEPRDSQVEIGRAHV